MKKTLLLVAMLTLALAMRGQAIQTHGDWFQRNMPELNDLHDKLEALQLSGEGMNPSNVGEEMKSKDENVLLMLACYTCVKPSMMFDKEYQATLKISEYCFKKLTRSKTYSQFAKTCLKDVRERQKQTGFRTQTGRTMHAVPQQNAPRKGRHRKK